MPLRGQEASATLGKGSAFGGINAQCSAYVAPCWTHRVRTSTSAGLRRLPAFLGGMRMVSSSSAIRAIEGARVRVARDDRRLPALERLDRRRPLVEPKPLGPLGLIGAVAGEAIPGEDRPDLAVEVDRPWGRAGFVAGGSAAGLSPGPGRRSRPAKAMQAA